MCYKRALIEAIELAERLRATVEDTPMLESKKITCSIGVTEIKEDDRFEDMFARMDKALYTAKSGGRNRVVAG